MSRRRVIQHAKNYLEQLSRGIDPISGQPVGQDTVASEPRLQRCFAYVSEILEEILETGGLVDLQEPGGARYERVIKKIPFRLTDRQRQNVCISPEPVSPAAFVGIVNRAIDPQNMEKLSVQSINAWLLNNGYVSQGKQLTVMNRTVLRPLEKAVEAGFTENEVRDPITGEIRTRLMLTPTAQRFVLDHLDSIIKEG